MALKRRQAEYPDVVEFEFVGTSEIESNAIKAYSAVHGDVKCYGDITKINWDEVPDFDLFTMSSPCQDFSVAGRQAGAEEGSGTRSSLLWECRKAIIAKRPKYILFENVSAVVSKKFIRGFNKWQAELESYGYTNFAKVLNSKDYGIPQNRERLFMISILDCTQSYHFPEPFKLEKRIKDILEPYGTVDESFYFKPEQLLRIIAHCDRKVDEGCGFKTQFHTEDEISGCVTTRYGQRETDPCIKEGISIHPLNRKMEFQGFKSIQSDTEPCLTAHDGRGGEPVLLQRLSLYGNNAQAGRVYDVEGIAPCLDTCCGGNRMPKILEPVIIQRPHGYNNGGEFSESAPTVTTSSWEHNNFCKEPVYSRLRETLEKADLKNKDSVISDEYNKVIYDDIAPTITTRVDASGNIRLIEKQPFILGNLPTRWSSKMRMAKAIFGRTVVYGASVSSIPLKRVD